MFIIDTCSSLEECNELEIFWIAYFKSIGCRLTNVTIGGGGANGMKQSPEAIAKRMAKCIGQKRSEETKKKLSESKKGEKNHMFGTKGFWYGKKRGSINKGNKHSEESKRLISIAVKNRIHSEETRRKISISNQGRKWTNESKEKLSESRKGMKFTEDHKKNMSLSKKGKTWTENRRIAQNNRIKK